MKEADLLSPSSRCQLQSTPGGTSVGELQRPLAFVHLHHPVELPKARSGATASLCLDTCT